MSFKSTISKFIIFTVVLFSAFYIFNFVTDKKDALANINNKQIVEVFKTPSCGCCYGYVLFLEEEKYRMYGETLEQNSIRDIHLFWLTLCDQFNRGFGMEDTDYYRFDVFSDEWYPKFDENEFRF